MPTTTATSIDRLGQAERARDAAMRELARVLARARLHADDSGVDVADLLLEAGYPEESEADTALLDEIAGCGRPELASDVAQILAAAAAPGGEGTWNAIRVSLEARTIRISGVPLGSGGVMLLVGEQGGEVHLDLDGMWLRHSGGGIEVAMVAKALDCEWPRDALPLWEALVLRLHGE